LILAKGELRAIAVPMPFGTPAFARHNRELKRTRASTMTKLLDRNRR